MSAEKHRDILAEFAGQMDETERLMFLQTLHLMQKSKSRAWSTRRMNEFGDWYREKRGLAP